MLGNESTELNKELNALNDQDLIDDKICELGCKGVKLEDMDENLFENLVDGFVSYRADYRKNVEKIKQLEKSNDCNKSNIQCRDEKIEKLEKEKQKILDECRQKSYRIEELERILDTFHIMASKIR